MSSTASIDAARRLASVEGARQMEFATWDFADAVVADLPTPDTRISGAHNRSTQDLALLAESLRRAGFDYSTHSLRAYRDTALAWSPETRVHEGAGFTVHRELRGRVDRVAVLRKLMGQHGGKVTQRQVRTWKQEQNPPKFQSWSELMLSRIRSVAKQAETPEAREEMASLLRQVAQEIESV